MIEKVRIRNVDQYLVGIQEGQQFFIGKRLDEVSSSKIQIIGFRSSPSQGEQLLPRVLGPVSRINAEGCFIKLKDRPKETHYREVAIKDWHGDYHYVDIPYKRYQRQIIPPYGIEIKVVEQDGVTYFVSPKLEKNRTNYVINKHVINLFLELFDSCEVLNESFVPAISSIPTRRVNWKILPEGEYPWDRLATLAENLKSNRIGKSKIQEHCVTKILNYRPTEIIYGTGGFRGYLVFRFPTKGIFVMENVMYGNATYVFENDWEQFSQMSKAEIIHNNLQRDRIEHRNGWENKIRQLLEY